MTEEEQKEAEALEECNRLISNRVEVLLHHLRAKANFKLYRQSIKDYMKDENKDVNVYF
jgi:hypothetical protein